jgi:hypothetical protein
LDFDKLLAAPQKRLELRRNLLEKSVWYFHSNLAARKFIRHCGPMRRLIDPLRWAPKRTNPQPSKTTRSYSWEDELLDGEVALYAIRHGWEWQNITANDLGWRGREHAKRSLRKRLHKMGYDPDLRSDNNSHRDLVRDATILLIQEVERLSAAPLRHASDCSAGPELIAAALNFIFWPLAVFGQDSIVKLIPEARTREPFQFDLWHGNKTCARSYSDS